MGRIKAVKLLNTKETVQVNLDVFAADSHFHQSFFRFDCARNRHESFRGPNITAAGLLVSTPKDSIWNEGFLWQEVVETHIYECIGGLQISFRDGSVFLTVQPTDPEGKIFSREGVKEVQLPFVSANVCWNE